MDRLAAESANFTHTFVQAPVCVPSRISYFTGRYPHSHRNRVNYTPCDPREVFFYRLLQAGGVPHGLGGQAAFPSAHRRTRAVHRLRRGATRRRGVADRPVFRLRAVAQGERPEGGRPLSRHGEESPENPFRAQIEYRYTPTAWVGAQGREVLREFRGVAGAVLPVRLVLQAALAAHGSGAVRRDVRRRGDPHGEAGLARGHPSGCRRRCRSRSCAGSRSTRRTAGSSSGSTAATTAASRWWTTRSACSWMNWSVRARRAIRS